jgi:hypothetical protein
MEGVNGGGAWRRLSNGTLEEELYNVFRLSKNITWSGGSCIKLDMQCNISYVEDVGYIWV